MWPRDDGERKQLIKEGFEEELNKVYYAEDLARGDGIMFARRVSVTAVAAGRGDSSATPPSLIDPHAGQYAHGRHIKAVHDLTKKTIRLRSRGQSNHCERNRTAANTAATSTATINEARSGASSNRRERVRISPQPGPQLPDQPERHLCVTGRYSQIQVRPGLEIDGRAVPPKKGSPQLAEIFKINGQRPEKWASLKKFDELTSVNPNERFNLETVGDRYTTRVFDLIAPLGKGTRGLIVAAPRTGKTTLLHHIADAVITNHPRFIRWCCWWTSGRRRRPTSAARSKAAKLLRRPTTRPLKSTSAPPRWRLNGPNGWVEFGRDVFIVLDSITRLARAFNN